MITYIACFLVVYAYVGCSSLMAMNGDKTVQGSLIDGAPVQVADQVILAAQSGDVAALRCLRAQGFSLQVRDGRCDATPLLWAIGRRHRQMIQFLLDETDTDVNALHRFNMTALIFAASQQDWITVRHLMKKNVHVNAQNGTGVTALIFAVSFADAPTVRELMRHGADPHLSSGLGTALEIAQQKNDTELMSLLLSGGTPQLKADAPVY